MMDYRLSKTERKSESLKYVRHGLVSLDAWYAKENVWEWNWLAAWKREGVGEKASASQLQLPSHLKIYFSDGAKKKSDAPIAKCTEEFGCLLPDLTWLVHVV